MDMFSDPEIVCAGGCFNSPQNWADAVIAYVRSQPAGASIPWQSLPTQEAGNLAVFRGTIQEALAAGWVENEFGWNCPACVAGGIHDTCGSEAKLEDADLVTFIAMIASLPTATDRRIAINGTRSGQKSRWLQLVALVDREIREAGGAAPAEPKFTAEMQ
jgi:hypothetical protein